MRVAALYDIHGNVPALEATLHDVRAEGVDGVVIGGDVMPGPFSGECLDLVLSLENARFIHGNGERAVLEMAAHGHTSMVPAPVLPAVRHVASELSANHVRAIGDWPSAVRIGDMLFCHATPRSDTEIFTQRTAEAVLLPIFDAAGASIVVCGHTHMQFDRMVGSTRVINAGSVGMPFGATGAFWLLIDGARCELRRTAYDLERAAALIREARYPGAEAFAQNNVLSTPSEEAVLAAWEEVELR